MPPPTRSSLPIHNIAQNALAKTHQCYSTDCISSISSLKRNVKATGGGCRANSCCASPGCPATEVAASTAKSPFGDSPCSGSNLGTFELSNRWRGTTSVAATAALAPAA